MLARSGQGQREQEYQTGHCGGGPGPLPGRRPAADGGRRDRQREHQGEYAERLHHRERPVRQRGDVQGGTRAVARHRQPPAGPAQDGAEIAPPCVPRRSGLGGEPFL
ncbi:hypothetical protein GCM10022225_54230 [Plantactinospora mayteni]|uniref:Uncharacterized protein n=1 Tax=Plantactinospora mayteni TaxID=566021 RepID=A0ABQ4ELF6_9ACTN|nr:hypothetical protein Pma05_16140 [Plantactinospora mayteni]